MFDKDLIEYRVQLKGFSLLTNCLGANDSSHMYKTMEQVRDVNKAMLVPQVLSEVYWYCQEIAKCD